MMCVTMQLLVCNESLCRKWYLTFQVHFGRYQVRIEAAQPPACSPPPPLANPLVATLPCLPSVNEVLVLQKRIGRLALKYGRLETNFVVNYPFLRSYSILHHNSAEKAGCSGCSILPERNSA